jgi:hypothetical protein
VTGTVTIVEACVPISNRGTDNSAVEADVAFIGSSREKAFAFIADNPNYGRGMVWCWHVYDMEIDDPKGLPVNRCVIGRDGKTYGAYKAAWDACEPSTEPSPSI